MQIGYETRSIKATRSYCGDENLSGQNTAEDPALQYDLRAQHCQSRKVIYLFWNIGKFGKHW